MIYGGGYGRTTYGGLIARIITVVGKIFKKGIGIILSVFGPSHTEIKSKRGVLLNTKKGGILNTRTNKKSIDTYKRDQPVLATRQINVLNSVKPSSHILNTSVAKVGLDTKGDRQVASGTDDVVITKSTSKPNDIVV